MLRIVLVVLALGLFSASLVGCHASAGVGKNSSSVAAPQ
jgi:predicted small secreted protein